MKRAIIYFFCAICVAPLSAVADSTPAFRIQVLAIHSGRISSATLSSTSNGDAFVEVVPPDSYDPLKERIPELILRGDEFSSPVEDFLLEIDFVNGTQVVVPIRLLLPTRDEIRQVRVSGEKIIETNYAEAIERAVDILSPRKAYEPFSLCSNYFRHAERHPSFLISAAICWVKSNRSMVLATKRPFRRIFGPDQEMLEQVDEILGKIETDELWQEALRKSFYPGVSASEIRNDLSILRLSEWRLFRLDEIVMLDKIYGAGTSCAALKHFRALAEDLDQLSVQAILDSSIGVREADLKSLVEPDLMLVSSDPCETGEAI